MRRPARANFTEVQSENDPASPNAAEIRQTPKALVVRWNFGVAAAVTLHLQGTHQVDDESTIAKVWLLSLEGLKRVVMGQDDAALQGDRLTLRK